MTSFTDKVVIITGAAAGIGKEAALQFARQGARVMVTGRRQAPLQELSRLHESIDFLVADAGRADAAACTVEIAIERYGRLDVLVNNAGSGTIAPLAGVNLETIEQMFAVNVFGPSMLTKAAIPHLTQTRGSIVNMSSTFGHKAAADLSHYASSKAALEHLTRCWALELAPKGIRVNAIAAGPTETEFLAARMGLTAEQVEAVKTAERSRIPLGRRGEAGDISSWIVSLASADASWITGQIISVDGGLDVT